MGIRKNNHKKNLLLSFFLLIIFLISLPNNATSTRPPPLPAKNTNNGFVLVHGGGHGAWCWYMLVDLIRSSGHNVTAIDLAASGINSVPLGDVRSLSVYFQPLMDLMASLRPEERVILVGHSFGGYAISKAMESFPEKISVAVFVAALMPGPSFNVSVINQEIARRQLLLRLDSIYTYGNGPTNTPTSFTFGPKHLARYLYQLSLKQVRMLATMLVRPHPLFSDEAMLKDMDLTTAKYGWVKRVFIIPSEDLAIPEDFHQWMITQNSPDQVEKIVGSDHMVMLSKPRKLWAHLQHIALKYR